MTQPGPSLHVTYDLIVIGAGPAGLAAAIRADGLGLKVALVDEQHDLGGQIMRQMPAGFSGKPARSPVSLPAGAELLERVRQSHCIARFQGAAAWGVFPDVGGQGVDVPISGAHSGVLHGRYLLLSTGAYDLPVAFPGWTLPGVMSAGGVQTMIKSQLLLPGKRFVLAGSHPLLLLVADLLLDAGAEIAEVAVARPLPDLGELFKGRAALRGHLRLFAQMARTLLRLKWNRVPLRFGTLVQAAAGMDQVERVTVARVDAEWKSIPDTQRSIDADTLVIGYGLLATTELARQAGCAVHWDGRLGGWIVDRDTNMVTSLPNILVAGEAAGVKGAELAALEGELAALHVAGRLRGGMSAAIDEIRARIAEAHIFADAVLEFFEPNFSGLAALVTDDTTVCRCEQVSAGTIREFLASHKHVSDVNSVKLGCRAGMGFCQGRYCQNTTAQLTAAACGLGPDAVGSFSARAPVKPITVRDLIASAAPDSF